MGDQMRSAPEMMKALENFHNQAGFKLCIMIIFHQRCQKIFGYSPDHPPVEKETVQYDNLFCNQSGSYGVAGLLTKSRVHCTMCTFYSIFFA